MMNKIYALFQLLSLTVVLLISSCSVNQNAFKRDYTYLYDENQKLIKPSFKIFHHQNDSSTVFFHIRSNDILYGRLEDSLLKANVWLKYKVYEDPGRSKFVDSTTIKLVNYGKNSNGKILQGNFKVKAPVGKTYPLEVRFRDENKDLNVVHDLMLDKRLNNNEQFFLLKSKEKVLVESMIHNPDSIILIKSPLAKGDFYELERLSINYSMSPPPFAENVKKELIENELSSSKINFIDNRYEIQNFAPINRLIAVENDTVFPYYFYYHYYGYPKITKVEQMIDPIRYISTSSEYKKVNQAVNSKVAIDNFWLNLGKNQDRAKKLIKEYYSRVEKANQFFTSYKEGWKTDRGIIFIVYGSPTTIYKDLGKETWIYGEENNILSIKFEFFKIKNPRSDNDYRMVRNKDYKNNWYRAVDQWRQAKIF